MSAASTTPREGHLQALSEHLPADPLRGVETLPAMLERRALLTPDRVACVVGERSCSYRELWKRAQQVAAFLLAEGLQLREPVLIRIGNEPEFFAAYYGTQLAGGVAVPVFHRAKPRRLQTVAGLCGASFLLVESAAVRASLSPQVGLRVRSVPDEAGEPPVPEERRPGPDDLAMLQYTSGSTGDPKGVMLTHRNLVANVRQLIPVGKLTEEDVFVSWMPLYHDMGLIIMSMMPFYLGSKLVLLPIKLDGHAWLKAIEEHGGTMTAAPDFGFRYALKTTRRSAHYALDTLRIALTAAEPIRADTVRRFEERFGLEGVVKPGYGLAEASVGVSFWRLDQPRILVGDNGAVSVGRGLPGTEIAIVAGGGFASPGVHGEILIKSPSCTQGYFRNPDATARLHVGGGYIRTGDLGYLDDDGNLYIVGRSKNLIIRAGQNIAPKEIEEVVEAHPAVLISAAVGIDLGRLDGEAIHVFVEIALADADQAQFVALARKLATQLRATLGFGPDQLFLLAPRSIPMTYNGKIRYPALQELFLSGQLARGGRILHPRTDPRALETEA